MTTPICGERVRGMGICTCILAAGHTGYHSVVDHGICDGCGRQMRSLPAAHGRPDTGEEGMALCFLCVKEGERWQARGWPEP